MAPGNMRHHLRLNQSRFLTSDDIVQEIEEYVDACEDGDQMMSGSVNAVGKGGKSKEKAGKVRTTQFDKGKGKSKDKDN